MYGDEDPTAALAAGLPYPQLVDAMRGGAAGFGMGPQRPLSKAEKLQGTLGSLESFFSRLSAIGNPHGLDQGAQLGVQHGQQMYQQALAAREEEAKGQVMMQAAQHRAALEQQMQEQQQAEHDKTMKLKYLEVLDRIGPDLGAPPLGPNEMGPQMDAPRPNDLAAAQAGDFSGVLRGYQPGRGKQREQEALAARELGVQRLRNEGDLEQTNIRERHADSRNAATNASNERRVPPRDSGNRVTLNDARGSIRAALERTKDLPPAAQLEAIKDYAKEAAGATWDKDAEAELRSTVAQLNRMALSGAFGGASIGMLPPKLK